MTLAPVQPPDAPQAEPPSIGRRATTAGAWVVTLRATVRGVSALRLLVLVQLLSPSEIGLFGIALLAIATLEQFSESGFREALIHDQQDVKGLLPTAWTFQVLRGLGLASLIFALAPWIAEMFGDPAATPLLRAVSVVVGLGAMENVAIIFLRKELTFGKYFAYEASSRLSDLLVSIVVAAIWPSYWALLLGLFAATVARVSLSYALVPWRPSFAFDAQQVQQLFQYGRWVYLSRVTTFLAMKGDQFVVARLLGPAALGVYQVTFVLADLLTKEITNTVGLVAFPAYAKIQADKPRLRRAFLLSFEIVASLVLPVSFLSVLLSEALAGAVLPGEEWSGVASVLPFLIGSGAIRAIVATGGSVYLAVGKPGYSFQINAGRVVLLFGLIWPLVNAYGLPGAAMAVFASTLVILPPFFMRLRELLQIDLRGVVVAAAPALALAAAVGIASEIALIAFPTFQLTAPLAAALLAYLLASLAMWKALGCGPLRLVGRLAEHRILAGRFGGRLSDEAGRP